MQVKTPRVLILLAAVLLVLALAGLPFCLKARRAALRQACLNELHHISEPLNCCIPLENKMKPGDAISMEKFLEFFSNKQMPRCPTGAEYWIPLVAGGRPVCSKHGDLLASEPGEVFGPKPIYPRQAINR